MYKNAVPHPNGQVAAEELFQLGIIPSDTDFRIFRDYGHIPGMDFAHVFNGYRYHTKFDHINYIPSGVLQRTGDNILALVKQMANSDELTNTDVSLITYTNIFQKLNRFCIIHRLMQLAEWFTLIFLDSILSLILKQLANYCTFLSLFCLSFYRFTFCI